MEISTVPHPPIVTHDEWLAQRKSLLAEEKELTKQSDRVNAARRRLPMVKIEKDYRFEGPHQGTHSLRELFAGRRQLIVYHFMFHPDWDKGCGGCTSFVDSLGDLSLLEKCDTTFVLISRAPFPKLEAYRVRKNWTRPWFSSYGSDFNYDYHVTIDPHVAPPEHNFKTEGKLPQSEAHGISVFFRLDDDLFHTYSTYARGTETLSNSYSLLDVTPYGRQQDFEDSPAGWPQKPTYGA